MNAQSESQYYENKDQLMVTNQNKFYIMTKRLIDIIASLVGIVFMTPIFIVFLLFYVSGDNKGPVFFKQIRIGKDRKEFKIYKFRSMVVNAEEKLKNNKELYKKYIDNSFKLEPDEDPRITKFGRFIRKTSLDELPQFINVFKGEMSLVGPRPVLHDELEEYAEKKATFLSVKPGLTGHWQTCGRSDVGYPERVDLELYYVYNQSLKLDLSIIFKTVYQVLMRKGAF